MNLPRLYRTVRPLQARQIISRLRRRWQRVDVGTISGTELAQEVVAWVPSVPGKAGMAGQNRFHLLNKTVAVTEPADWNRPDLDKLLLYHLHYHDVLNAKHGQEFGSCVIDRWIDDNPPVIGNGWEPYTISLRIVNWIKWHLRGRRLRDAQLDSLYLQCRALFQQIEYHLLANHLLANGKALLFSGLFFQGREPDIWLRTAIHILERELPEQVLDDGAHFELSPMYHAIVLEDVLDMINVSRVYGFSIDPPVELRVRDMFRWLRTMTHPDGQISYFNDAAFDVAPSLAELGTYAERLETPVGGGPEHGLTVLRDSGYAVWRSDRLYVAADVGRFGPKYQPGHGHCDCLSFELAHGNERIIVNSGVSTYSVGDRRLAERGTAAHNTVTIAGLEQSEIWSAFRVGRRARPFDVEFGETYVRASHDGYARLGITHRREFRFADDEVVILDTLQGNDQHPGVAHFHLFPQVEPVIDDVRVAAADLVIEFQGADAVELCDYEFAAGFNRRVPARKICVTFRSDLKSSIRYAHSVR